MHMKQLIALTLVFSLFFASAALAGEEVTVSFPASVSGGNGAVATVPFDPEWFTESALDYRHGLCLCSLGLALSAFRGGSQAPDAAIRDFLGQLDFSAVETCQFDVTGRDTIGTAIAHRMIEGENGAFPLVVIAVSGGNYGQEWLSNFDTGTGAVHQGFSRAAKETVARAAAYIAENKLTQPRFWISGYSRGAAVSNLAAAYLAQDSLARDEAIFAYTFATPRTVRGAEAARHPNIFNIVNTADLVPQVPLAAWGYARYGRTLSLPSSLCEGMDYAGLLGGYEKAYEALTGQSPDSLGDAAFAGMAVAAARGLYITVPTPEKYTAHYQGILGKVFLGQETTGAEKALLLTLLMNLGNAALRDSGAGITIIEGLDNALQSLTGILPVFYQHMPEIYFSWLLSLPDGEFLLKNSLTLTDAPVF